MVEHVIRGDTEVAAQVGGCLVEIHIESRYQIDLIDVAVLVELEFNDLHAYVTVPSKCASRCPYPDVPSSRPAV